MPPRKQQAPSSSLPDNVALPEALASVIPGLARGSSKLGSDIPYWISTQIPILDYIIGQPGIPGGHVTTLFGKEGGAKSTVAQHIIAECQSMGGIAMLADSERRWSRDRAQRIGVDVDSLLFITDPTLEGVLATMEAGAFKIREKDDKIPILIVIDSLAALPPKDLYEAELDKILPAKTAAIMSKYFNRSHLKLADNGITLVIVNQTRSHMVIDNGMRIHEARKVMGERQAMLAENALVYYSDLMIYLQSAGFYGEDKDNPEGINVRARLKKDSVGPGEDKHCEFDVSFLNGARRDDSKLDLLLLLGVITQSGGWYEYPPLDKKFRRDDFPEVLKDRSELQELLAQAPELWKTGNEIHQSED